MASAWGVTEAEARSFLQHIADTEGGRRAGMCPFAPKFPQGRRRIVVGIDCGVVCTCMVTYWNCELGCFCYALISAAELRDPSTKIGRAHQAIMARALGTQRRRISDKNCRLFSRHYLRRCRRKNQKPKKPEAPKQHTERPSPAEVQPATTERRPTSNIGNLEQLVAYAASLQDSVGTAIAKARTSTSWSRRRLTCKLERRSLLVRFIQAILDLGKQTGQDVVLAVGNGRFDGCLRSGGVAPSVGAGTVENTMLRMAGIESTLIGEFRTSQLGPNGDVMVAGLPPIAEGGPRRPTINAMTKATTLEAILSAALTPATAALATTPAAQPAAPAASSSSSTSSAASTAAPAAVAAPVGAATRTGRAPKKRDRDSPELAEKAPLHERTRPRSSGGKASSSPSSTATSAASSSSSSSSSSSAAAAAVGAATRTGRAPKKRDRDSPELAADPSPAKRQELVEQVQTARKQRKSRWGGTVWSLCSSDSPFIHRDLNSARTIFATSRPKMSEGCRSFENISPPYVVECRGRVETL